MNDKTRISKELDRIAEVAGYLWQRNWAEANGGNISVNLSHLADPDSGEFCKPSNVARLADPLTYINDNIFYVTGAGKRMRDVAKSPLENGALIRITDDGKAFEIVSEYPVNPTSELPSHLSIQNFLAKRGSNQIVVIHTHPTELIALTHCPPFLDWKYLTQMLWSMIPETRVLISKGVGIVPYVLTGTTAMAKATITQLEKHDVVLWEKHGALAVSNDIMHCFDLIDTASKSARIYLAARAAGFEPQGLSQEQLDELSKAFNLPLEIE